MREIQVSYNFDEMANDQYLINTLSGFARNWQTKNGLSNILARQSFSLKQKIQEELNTY